MTHRVAKKRAKEFCRHHNLEVVITTPDHIIVKGAGEFRSRQIGDYTVCTMEVYHAKQTAPNQGAKA